VRRSTLISAVLAALGDYADAADPDPDLLTAKTFDAHPTSVADLYGLRLAVLHETDAGRRLQAVPPCHQPTTIRSSPKSATISTWPPSALT
jgi:hypothetical protein